MRNIILIGMPAVGKSTVGVIVAKRLGWGRRAKNKKMNFRFCK